MAGCSGQEKKSETKTEVNGTEEITLYLTRHGKTMMNTMDLSQGWVDSPLTPQGIEVAEKLGKGLKKADVTFDKVYSSDSGRARETASLILKNNGQKDVAVKEDQRFREANFGSYEAKPNQEMAEAAIKQSGLSPEEFMGNDVFTAISNLSDALYEIDQQKDDSEMGWPAENSKQVVDRLVEGTDEIIKNAKKDDDQNILIVFHGNSIIKLLHELDPEAKITSIDNAGVSKVVYKNGKFKVDSVNDTSFIE